nr:transcription repressor OFP7-like [Ipomoea batatas]
MLSHLCYSYGIIYFFSDFLLNILDEKSKRHKGIKPYAPEKNSRQIPEGRDVQSLKQLPLRSAAGEVDAVVPVSGNNAILSGNRGLHTYRDGFLAVVEMAKSANELRLVERIGGDLHPAHQSHIAEEGHQLLRRRLYGARRRIDVVTAEREAGLHGDGGGGVRRQVADNIRSHPFISQTTCITQQLNNYTKLITAVDFPVTNTHRSSSALRRHVSSTLISVGCGLTFRNSDDDNDEVLALPPLPPPPSTAERKKRWARKKRTATALRISTSSADESGLFSNDEEDTQINRVVVNGLQEVDDGDDFGEANVREGGSGTAVAVLSVFECEEAVPRDYRQRFLGDLSGIILYC